MTTTYTIGKNQLNTKDASFDFHIALFAKTLQVCMIGNFYKTFQEVAVIERVDCPCARTQF